MTSITTRRINCRRGPRNRTGWVNTTPRRKRSPEEIYATRERLFQIQRGLCAICGEPLDPVIHRATTDHVIPLALGGRDAAGNYVVAHGKCNGWKANDKPTGCEMVWLLLVNTELGVGPQVF